MKLVSKSQNWCCPTLLFCSHFVNCLFFFFRYLLFWIYLLLKSPPLFWWAFWSSFYLKLDFQFARPVVTLIYVRSGIDAFALQLSRLHNLDWFVNLLCPHCFIMCSCFKEYICRLIQKSQEVNKKVLKLGDEWRFCLHLLAHKCIVINEISSSLLQYFS